MTGSTKGALLGIHAQTALHPGSGTALGVVDLPIQRERHTHWPNVAGSAVKGVLRDVYREHISRLEGLDDEPRCDDEFEDGEVLTAGGNPKLKKKSELRGQQRARAKSDWTLRLNVLFGPPTARASEFAGVLSVTDARLLAFPVRSLRGVFAWATCPAVLQRLHRDAALANIAPCPMPRDLNVNDRMCAVIAPSPCMVTQGGRSSVVLEEFDFEPCELDIRSTAKWISDHLLPSTADYQFTRERLQTHLVVLSDNDFTHFARNSTEVTARIGLDYDSKTVKTGALFYQEFLPAETLLYCVVLRNPARASRCDKATADEFYSAWAKSLNDHRFLQIGGDESTGKGLCAVHLTAENSQGETT